jgi:hypothetical protein
MWVSMARARSALPFIESPGKRLPTIAATSNDAWHVGAPAEARGGRRLACHCSRVAQAFSLGGVRSPQTRDNSRKHRAAARADPTIEIELFINLKTRKAVRSYFPDPAARPRFQVIE